MNRMAVTRIKRNHQQFTALISLDEKRNFGELQVFEPEEQALLEQIYIARVERIVPGIHAAFVRISPEQKCYLPLEHIKNVIFTKKQSEKQILCEGDELVVQVIKEAVKTKAPIVSTKLTLTGRYSILTSDNTFLGVSKKIAGELRQELAAFLEELCPDHEEFGYGILLRTNCTHVNREELKVDILNLIGQWKRLREQAPHQNAYTLLVPHIPGYIREMQSISFDNTDKIYTDDPTIYEGISHYLPYLKNQDKLELYKDEQISLSALYHIQGNLEKLLNKQVWLPSGGNLIIEQVETMTVIDVNSAKISAKNKKTALTVNKEAALEIPKQLRLRNISGMIIVDFINVETPEQEEEFLSILKTELKKDTVPSQFIDMTKLGLVEITRKKVRKSLRETLE